MTMIEFFEKFSSWINLGLLLSLFVWLWNHLSKTKRDEINNFKEAKNTELKVLEEKMSIQIIGYERELSMYKLLAQDITKEKFDEYKKRVDDLEKELNNEKEINIIKEKMKDIQNQRIKSFYAFSSLTPSSPDQDFDNKIFQHCIDLLNKDDLISQLHAIRLLSVIPIDKAQEAVIENLYNDNSHIRTMAMNSIIVMSIYDREKIIPKVLNKVFEGKHLVIKDIIRLLRVISEKRHVELIKDTIDILNDPGIMEFFIHEFEIKNAT